MIRFKVNDAICEALFASPLQPSDQMSADSVGEAISNTLRRLGAVGCSGHMAEQFGSYPNEAADRMRWVRQLAHELCGCLYIPTGRLDTTSSAATGMLPVREAA